jgi:hypothetical protein
VSLRQPRRGVGLLKLAPAMALLLLSGRALPDETPPPRDPSLPQPELDTRREALKSRIFEPAVLEASSFRLGFERASSSLVLEDRRTAVGWHSPLGRKGFATVFVYEGNQGLPVDQVEELRIEEKSIRFRGRSSKGFLPGIEFELKVMEPLVGLEVSFQVDEASAGQVRRVRLLDGWPWVADDDGGGAIVPAGLGEWQEADSGPAFIRRFRSEEGPYRETKGPLEPAYLSALGVVRGQGPGKDTAALLVRWDSPEAEIEVRRGPVDSPGFPGRSGIVSTLDCPGPRGAARLYPLGKGDAMDIAQSFRQLVQKEEKPPNLRLKIGDRERLRAILGAAVMRPTLVERAPGAGGRLLRSLEEVGALAERWKKTLEIDEALVLLDGWNARSAGEPNQAGPLLPAAALLGGDPALKRLAERVRRLGYLFGLRAAGAEAIEPALGPLKELLEPDLLLVAAPEGPLPREGSTLSRTAGPLALGEAIASRLGIAGTDGASGPFTQTYGYLEGLLSEKVLHPVDRPFSPLYAFGYGHSARITVRPEEAVGPDQPERILAHLVLGEVPLYALPPPGAVRESEPPPGDPRFSLARGDGGWSAQKELTARERFLKNTYEVLSQVARLRFRTPILFHRFLTPDRTVEETYFGEDLRVVVNYGEREYADEEAGFKLPRYGFWVHHPFFFAFHATRAGGVDYPEPALFTVRSLEGKIYLRAEAVRIFHGFGPARIQLGGRDFQVEREQVVKIW